MSFNFFIAQPHSVIHNEVEKAKTDNAKAWEFYDLLEYCAEQLEKQPSELLDEFYEWLDKKSDEQN